MLRELKTIFHDLPNILGSLDTRKYKHNFIHKNDVKYIFTK